MTHLAAAEDILSISIDKSNHIDEGCIEGTVAAKRERKISRSHYFKDMGDGPERDERENETCGRLGVSPLTLDVQFLPGGGQMRGEELWHSLEQRETQGHTHKYFYS